MSNRRLTRRQRMEMIRATACAVVSGATRAVIAWLLDQLH